MRMQIIQAGEAYMEGRQTRSECCVPGRCLGAEVTESAYEKRKGRTAWRQVGL